MSASSSGAGSAVGVGGFATVERDRLAGAGVEPFVARFAVVDFAVVDFAVVDFAVVDFAVVDFAVVDFAVVDFEAFVAPAAVDFAVELERLVADSGLDGSAAGLSGAGVVAG